MRHKLSLSQGTRRVLELSLNTLRQKSGQDDWVSEEDIPKNTKGRSIFCKEFFFQLTLQTSYLQFSSVMAGINGINGSFASQDRVLMKSSIGMVLVGSYLVLYTHGWLYTMVLETVFNAEEQQ